MGGCMKGSGVTLKRRVGMQAVRDRGAGEGRLESLLPPDSGLAPPIANQKTAMWRRFVPALAVVLLASLVVEVLAVLAWHPSMGDLGKIGAYLAISCLLSVGVMGG